MPDKSILDLSRLEEAFEDDVVGIADLLEMALETGAKHVRSMREGIEAHEIEKVSRAAHGVKGSASNIGAPAVTAVATSIEERARLGSWDDIPGLTDRLEATYAELRAAVGQYRAEVR